jgi:hypothetical protein
MSAIAPVTGLATELRTDPAVLVTDVARPVSGLLAAELAPELRVVPVDPGPVSPEATDVTDDGDPEVSSPVAACACLEKIIRRNKIPAAAIANCATRTVTRYANSCDIDSSRRQGN